MAVEHRHKIERLGFESVDSLAQAIRLERCELERTVELCKSGYPYDDWKEPKKSGNGFRLIEHPHFELKKVQSAVNRLLQRVVVPRNFHGCIAGTSIKTNASPHCQDSWFLGLDIADYYQNIRPSKVYDGLRSLGASPDVARALTSITTIHHHVPQGAPTSPVIAAIAMLKLARRIAELVASFKGRFTIFGDNLSLSASRDLRRYQNTLIRIIRMEGFQIRADKTVICRPGADKPLPGLIIRERRITIADEDKLSVEQLISQCRSLGASGLSRRVCPRFGYRLRGLVNHYAWLDDKMMRPVEDRFSTIEWPETYERGACHTLTCHCM